MCLTSCLWLEARDLLSSQTEIPRSHEAGSIKHKALKHVMGGPLKQEALLGLVVVYHDLIRE